MAHYDFQDDFQDGLKGENEVEKLLRAYFTVHIIDDSAIPSRLLGNKSLVARTESCKTSAYDLKVFFDTWVCDYAEIMLPPHRLLVLAKNGIIMTPEGQLEMSFKPLTFEVKTDFMAAETDNIAVEYECRGKASGIAITQADYWVCLFAGACFMVKTEDLKKELEEKKYKSRTGGDSDSNTKMYLMPINDFVNIGIRLK